MFDLTTEELELASGGVGVSAETFGCAIGGAMGSYLGSWGAAAGCIAGGAYANWYVSPGGQKFVRNYFLII
jgi:hypothetical protein